MKIRYNPNLKARSRELRNAGVVSEVLPWEAIKGRRLRGFQFSRQKPIGEYIVDFYCGKLGLVIEIDGSSHNTKTDEDLRKQMALQSLGLSVLKFQDLDVKRNLAGVTAMILEWIDRHARNASR